MKKVNHSKSFIWVDKNVNSFENQFYCKIFHYLGYTGFKVTDNLEDYVSYLKSDEA